MTLEELVKKDKTFSESSFIAKADNTFIMLLTSITTDNMPRVKHRVDVNIYYEYTNYVNELNKKNQRQMYDELNVKTTKIIKIEEDEKNYIITAKLVSRYMNYIIDKSTLKFISGNNESRVEKTYFLTFKKSKITKEESMTKKCPGCGANIDINNNGICNYCGSSYDTQNYDWVLTEIK